MKRNTLVLMAAILSLLLGACSGAAPESGASSSAPAAAESAEAPAEAYGADQFEVDDDAVALPQEDYMQDAGDAARSAGGESYLVIDENRETAVASESTMTFSLKVDTAAYTNVARYIESGNLPPRDAVRTEELVNYFRYDADMNFNGEPFAVYTEVGPSPFSSGKQMAFVRVKTQEIDKERLPSSNLTFLIDTSGSMDSYDKLPLLKEAFTLLVETLDEDDKVSIVTYAGSSAVVLDSVSGADQDGILRAINNLNAGGSTAGAKGITTAYALAEKNFVEGGNNRVILATDGDFNVGLDNPDDLAGLVGEKRDSGVYLSILGFGTGNIRDDIMETLSKNGNGNYSYINSVATAKKVLVDELGSNLFTIAEDVKAQIEFNPANVSSYRLIGYENRQLNNEDFADDTKDAGEIGVGTDVVMLFELEPAGGTESSGERKYESAQPAGNYSNELFEVRIRYKDPGQSESNLLTKPVTIDDIVGEGSTDYRFACSVAAFGHLLRDSEYTGDATLDSVISLAKGSLGEDPEGYRLEHLLLLQQYKNIRG